MRKIFKGILSLGLAIAVCAGTTAFYGGAEYTVAQAATTTAATYYDGITATKGTALLGQLHDLIVDTHKTYTSYDDCKRYGPTTDPGLDGRGALEFYTHETIMSFVGGVGDWNREHVWCQSLSNGLWGTSGGGSDLHHIRPSESGLNSIRGNNKYGVVSGGKEAWSRDNNKNDSRLGGHVGGGAFEPLDNVKGDVARIVMYVYTHYNNASNVGGSKESKMTHGNLPFTNVISASNEAAAKKLLLQWNKLDPVDSIETKRNEEAYKIQGNRNPFIDNESYAEAIWGDGTAIDPDPPTPSNTLKSLSLNATAFTLNVGGTYDLTVTPNPSNASASVNWTSSNSAVATVANGKVTAKSAGTATITATSTSNSSIKATASVTVVGSTTIDPKPDPDTDTEKATITRDSFTNASSAYGFQDWSAGGIEGIAFIFGGNSEEMQFNTSKASYYLASTSATPAAIKSVKVTASKNSAEWQLFTSTIPYEEVGGAPNSGNDQGAKEVSASGATWTVGGNDTYFALVRSGKSGAAYLESIEVEYASGGGSGTTTDDELEEIIVTPSEFTMDEGTTAELAVIPIPTTAKADVTWSSSDSSVATVSADGTVTAVSEGTATITATSKDNPDIKASSIVTVEAKSSGGDDPVVDDDPVNKEKLETFRAAVAAIKSDGTLAEWSDSINAAVRAYRALSEKEKEEAVDDIETLLAEITSYNEKVRAYNAAANGADGTALAGAGRLF